MKTGQVSKMVKSRKYRHLGGNTIGGDPNTLEPLAAKWLVCRFGIRTVLDVGSGEGHMVREFQKLGCQAIGLDGLPRNADVSTSPTIVWDLAKGPLKIGAIDLIWCSDLVEHVSEKYVGNVIQTLANGAIVVIVYAAPGKRGWHHVNCQTAKYWDNLLSKAGYKFSKEYTSGLRSKCSGYAKNRGLVFTRCLPS